MERFKITNYGLYRSVSVPYNVSEVTTLCAEVNYGYKLNSSYDMDSVIRVKEEEVSNLRFLNYPQYNLLSKQEMLVEIANRELHSGDLVVGYKKVRKHYNVYMGIYIGKKSIYTVDGEVKCSSAFLILPEYMYEDEIKLLNRLKLMYTQSMSFNLNQSSLSAIKYGDIMCNVVNNLYLYLGEYIIDNSLSYVYLNFITTSKKQQEFLSFLKGIKKCKLQSDNYEYYSTKIQVTDLRLHGLLFSIFYACSGKFIVTKKQKTFSTYICHVNINEEERLNLRFKEIEKGYMLD